MIITPEAPIDLSKIEYGQKYFVRVVDCQRFEKQGKAQSLCWSLEITRGELSGTTIPYHTSIAGRGGWFLTQFLKVINPHYNGGRFDTDEYIGREFVIRIEKKAHDSKYPQITPLPIPATM